MSNNIDDLASYFQYQNLFPTSANSVDSTSVSGTAGNLLEGILSDDLYSITVQVPGPTPSSPTVAISALDLLASPPPSINYTVTNNLVGSSASNYVVYTPSNGVNQDVIFNFANDPNVMTLQEVYNFYQANAQATNSADWNNVSYLQPNGSGLNFPASSQYVTDSSGSWVNQNDPPAFWQQTDSQQFLNFWFDIQMASGGGAISPPPTTYEGFVQAMNALQMIPTSALTGAGYSVPTTYTAESGLGLPSSFATFVNSISLTPALQYTPDTSSSPSSSSSSLLGSLLNSFILNYSPSAPTTTGGSPNTTIPATAEIFAAQFQTWITANLAQAIQSASVQVTVTGGGVSTPIPYKSVSGASLFPNASTLSNAVTFPSDFASTFAQDLEDEYNSALQASTTWSSGSDSLTVETGSTADFNTAFGYFLQNVVQAASQQAISNYNSNDPGPLTSQLAQNFFSLWSQYVGPSTMLGTVPQGGGNSELDVYYRLYQAFYPSPTGSAADFVTNLNAFIQNAMDSSSGVFNPNLLIDQWMQKLQAGFATYTTSLEAAGFSHTSLINAAYQGLIDVINDMQNLTLAQASRLNFYSDYAEAYTNAINNIYFFVPNDGSPLQMASDPATTSTAPSMAAQMAQFRQQADTAGNTWIQNLQNFRTQVTSNAQAQQTAVQQSNSAVNAQTNFATSILQLYNQLLQTIFANIQANSNNQPY